jgi:hypothetical protein
VSTADICTKTAAVAAPIIGGYGTFLCSPYITPFLDQTVVLGLGVAAFGTLALIDGYNYFTRA